MSEFPAYVAYGHEHSRNEEFTPSQVGGETLVVGEFAIWDDSNNWIERAGTNPTAIVGLCEVDSEAARVLTENGKIPLRRILPGCVIALSSTTTLTEADHLFAEYGITRSSGGKWQLDTSKTTTNARVKIIRIDTGKNIAFCEVLQEFLVSEIDS